MKPQKDRWKHLSGYCEFKSVNFLSSKIYGGLFTTSSNAS